MEILFLILIIIIVVVFYLSFRSTARKSLDDIRTGKSKTLVKWLYSPEDWLWYAGDPSGGSWIKHKEVPGEVFITPDCIYVTNGYDECVYGFGGVTMITQCSFFHSFLEMRIEWTSSNQGQVIYHHKDFRLFVPKNQKETVAKLAAEFKILAKENSEFSQKYVKNNEIISLFGDDN